MTNAENWKYHKNHTDFSSCLFYWHIFKLKHYKAKYGKKSILKTYLEMHLTCKWLRSITVFSQLKFEMISLHILYYHLLAPLTISNIYKIFFSPCSDHPTRHKYSIRTNLKIKYTIISSEGFWLIQIVFD